jgi:beta-lactamase regulating signal transducer with metallopeptidase domain
VNAFGWLILDSIAHATVFAVIGSMAYLALRHFSPAAGALAAASSLMITAFVSIIALGPWPRWWKFTAGQEVYPVEAISAEMPNASQEPRPRGGDSLARAPEAAGATKSHSPISEDKTAAPPAWMGRFPSQLRRTVAERDWPRWSWPEWVAVGFFASVGLALARLGLGVWSIQRLRALSLPIDDPDLFDMVEILRAELSCARKVEIRETTELATPATIGWRRPLLLLPGDWRDWTVAERRAVLAHELAHVCRGDYLTGMAAQVSLTLHFYNPLAHWLATRLRLEQELAADAWGACLAGGKQSYLATLAQMALRRDSRALTWPARAFLPSRGNFVRRIEMLRNTRSIRHAPLPTLARLLTVGVLSALGLGVAGVRGQTASSSAQAQSQEVAAVSAKTPGNESYNLAFLPEDAKMIIGVRPHALLEHPELRALLESIKQSPMFKGALLVPPEDVEQILVFWEGVATAEPGPIPVVPFPSGGVLRTSKPQDWKSVLNKTHPGSIREVRHDGQTYFGRGRLWGAFAPDDRTLVFAREDLLRELIEDRKAPAPRHSWDEAWNKVAKGHVMVALETRWLRRRIAQEMQRGSTAPRRAPDADLKLETISPLLEKARSYAMSIAASGGLAVDLVAVAGTEDDAKPVANTLQALLTLAKNAAQGMRQDLRGQNAANDEAMDWIVEAADSLFNGARLETSGSHVHLQAKSSLDLAGGVKLLAPAVAAESMASRRKESVNNLKHIALAFHNYYSTNGRFPAPVLYGGATGKVPYSWRVAILPYLEQQEMYNQYNFDEPWDGPSNRKLVDKMPTVYSHPGADGGPSSHINASYFVFTGKGTALSPSSNAGAAGGIGGAGSGPTGPTFSDITDGTSNTILAVEAKREIPWTKPEDIPFDPNGPVPELGNFSPDGFNTVFADGAVRFISKKVSPTVLKALITRAGGEVVSTDAF